jgi:hypothetical protein
MQSGSWLRISVPSLDKYVSYYMRKTTPKMFATRWKVRGEALWSLTQNWGHKSVWNYEMLSKVLKGVVFINTKEVSYKRGSDPRIVRDLPCHQWESLYIEAKKP